MWYKYIKSHGKYWSECIGSWLTYSVIYLSSLIKYNDWCEIMYNVLRDHVAQNETCICAALYNHDFGMKLIMSR
jgi:hypothetical protein